MHPGQPGAVIQATIGFMIVVVMMMVVVVVVIAMGMIMAVAVTMAVFMGMVMIMMVMIVIMAMRLIFNGRGPATTDGTHHSTSNSFTRRSSPPVI